MANLAKKEALMQFKDLLVKNQSKFNSIASKALAPDKIINLALLACTRQPALLTCTPQSILRCALISAQLGLDPSGILRQAHIVAYGNEATFISGYGGLLELARRDKRVSHIESRIVHAEDSFQYEFGTANYIKHIPAQTDKPGDVTHAYSICYYENGKFQFDVMTKKEIDRIKTMAKTQSIWNQHYEEMAKKTVLRRLSKWIPQSPELQQALALDDALEAGNSQANIIDLEVEEENNSKTAELKDKLKQPLDPDMPVIEEPRQEEWQRAAIEKEKKEGKK